MIANDAVRIPPGPRIWSTEVAGGRMHTIVDGRAVVVPTRADLVGRDLLAIKTPDEEPTGAGLVGKVCDFSDNGADWTMGNLWTGKNGVDPRICTGFSPDAELKYHNANCAWKYVRLYREDRP